MKRILLPLGFGLAAYLCLAAYSPKADQIQTGTINVALLELLKTNSFTTPMRSTNYAVFTSPLDNLSVVTWVTLRTTTNFVFNISASISGSFNWLAVPQ